MGNYDKIYQEEDHFGKPYPGLMAFFEAYEPKGSVLDLGCGQGRDSLALARIGYSVTGVDMSAVGVEQMLKQARREGLHVEGVVANMYQFESFVEYDIVLLDSMLHFYKREREMETQLLERIMEEMRSGAVLCVLVLKSKTTEPVLDQILSRLEAGWKPLEDKYVKYPEKNALYRMVVREKK